MRKEYLLALEQKISMKIVLAIDSFKGCASSQELSTWIEEGIKEVYHEALCRRYIAGWRRGHAFCHYAKYSW